MLDPSHPYVPSVACARCRTVARCRHCTGPLALAERGAEGATCRWCGRMDVVLRCRRCGSGEVRAVVVGARRTAEELGRAFPGFPVITSAGDAVRREIDPGLALDVEDDARRVDHGLLARQRGEPVGHRIRADGRGEDARRLWEFGIRHGKTQQCPTAGGRVNAADREISAHRSPLARKVGRDRWARRLTWRTSTAGPAVPPYPRPDSQRCIRRAVSRSRGRGRRLDGSRGLGNGR